MSAADPYLAGKPCPKCGYARSAADTNPEWQCPRCHIAYVKFDPETAKLTLEKLGPRLAASGRELAIEARADRSVYGLIVANFVALGVAAATGMTLRELMFLYWLQSVMIGISYFVRVLSLRAYVTDGLEKLEGLSWDAMSHPRLMVALFFLAHYGGFHFGYFMFLVEFADRDTPTFGPALGPLGGFSVAAIALAAAHLFSLHENLARDRDTVVNLRMLMLVPYARVVPMHLAIIAGYELGPGPVPFYAFAALKIVADVTMHVIEHHMLRKGHLLAEPRDVQP